jgi:hypothetical protein
LLCLSSPRSGAYANTFFATKNRPFKPSFVVIAVGQYLGERVYCHGALSAKDQAAKAKYLHADF